eukprot:4248157-Amphidinium_carterae.2
MKVLYMTTQTSEESAQTLPLCLCLIGTGVPVITSDPQKPDLSKNLVSAETTLLFLSNGVAAVQCLMQVHSSVRSCSSSSVTPLGCQRFQIARLGVVEAVSEIASSNEEVVYIATDATWR